MVAPALPGHRPQALAVDEMGTLFWLESRVDDDGVKEGQIRLQKPSSGGPPGLFGPALPVGSGGYALVAWRGNCYLAAPTGLQTLRNTGKSDPNGMVRKLPIPGKNSAGFSALALGPDGRLHGEFRVAPGVGGTRAAPPRGSHFVLEPDGADFEVIHHGLPHRAPADRDPAGRGVGVVAAADGVPGAEHEWREDIVAACRDWNGRLHVLLFRDGGRGDPQVEVVAPKSSARDNPTDEIIGTINEHLDGDSEGDSEELRAFLAHDEQRVRWLSAWALTRKGDGFEWLAAAANEGSPETRAAALAGIGILARLGHGLFVPGDDPDFSPLPKSDLARSAAVVTARFLSHPTPATRVQALKILASAMRPAGLIPYAELLKDRDPSVRDQALLTAGRLRQLAVLDLLPDAEEDPPLNLDRLADMMSASFENEQLVPFRHHPDRRIRWAAMKVLQRQPEAGLGYFIFDTDPGIAGDAVLAIEAAGLEDLHPLIAKRVRDGLPADWSEPARRAAQRCAKGVAEAPSD